MKKKHKQRLKEAYLMTKAERDISIHILDKIDNLDKRTNSLIDVTDSHADTIDTLKERIETLELKVNNPLTVDDLHLTRYNGRPLELLIDGEPLSEILKRQHSVQNNNTDVKENFTTETEAEPDWENLLTYDEVKDCCHYPTVFQDKQELNKLIYNKIKPLLEAEQTHPDWDWDITKWTYADKFVYDKHLNERLVEDVSREITEINNDKLKPFSERFADTNKIIEVRFKINEGITFIYDEGRADCTHSLYYYCHKNNIDQSRIKRILLEMKSEDE